ncbi:hypothetical protein A3J13_01290 [Candidatus Daviesbacteria bacterium RIFCSPLOWO2_02_FULL_36_8]|uniref:Uncharacterized protein n=1 Tax=Candidatus Daviesbacteria bacterium RIFCSPLOWO2_02_FULL_36_8 TaxID=1797793 RepID=A0A1F5MGW8_9BACT|nr:MAG: hypothetical protein A3J13_01290 [Candidatus Daviesbacteria bacterium RIFCSPLOWO2_02_FULL_36_8]
MSKPKDSVKIKVPDHVILQLLTSSEVRMLKNRWQIINLLRDGLSIRGIAKEVKVGTDTVVRVARMFEKGNLGKKVIRPILTRVKTNTPWIFGKSD